MSDPLWLETAKKEVGTKEVSGTGSNPRIEEYHKIGSNQPGWKDDVSWCASFVGWVLEESGLPSTNSGMARSYVSYGNPLVTPQVGCIAVYERGDPPAGHVGFWIRREGEYDVLLDGNSNNEVGYHSIKASRNLAYRWPKMQVIPAPVPPTPVVLEPAPQKNWVERLIEWIVGQFS